MVDQVESELFSTAESRQQTQTWVQSPMPVIRTKCINERIGD